MKRIVILISDNINEEYLLHLLARSLTLQQLHINRLTINGTQYNLNPRRTFIRRA